MANIGYAIQEPTPQQPVGSAISNLQYEINGLSDVLAMLIGRLSSVCVPPSNVKPLVGSSHPDVSPPIAVASEITERVVAQSGRIGALRDQINDVLARLEL